MIKKIVFVLLYLMSIVSYCNAESYCFIGDSRFVAMREALGDDENIYYCEIGVGYNFYWENRSDIMQLSRDDTIIIYNLGVNDLAKQKHVEAINDLFKNGFERVIFMTVNPVEELKEKAYGYSIKNSEIDAFNIYVKENVLSNIMILNSNNFLKNDGFDTIDGIHYSNETYAKIYNYLFSYL